MPHLLTKVTKAGLLTLYRLKLTYLNIGKVISNLGGNNYGGEEALVVTRHLISLEILLVSDNKLGHEGATAIANGLSKLKKLGVENNEQDVCILGRLPLLDELYASIYEAYADNTGAKDWTVIVLARQLRRLRLLWIGRKA